MLRRFALCFVVFLTSSVVAAEGRRLAFLISVQECKDPRLKRLWFCDDDIHGMADVLPSLGFAPENISIVTQRASVDKKSDALKPSASRIKSGLQRLCKDANPDDTVLVAFSGHGVQLKRDGRIYLCPPEAQLDIPTSLIPIDDIFKTIGSHCKARVKLLLVDACRNDPTDGRPDTAATLARPFDPDPPSGVAAFFSCARGQGSFETGKLMHGLFFHHVILGLNGAAEDVTGDITLPSLENYLVREVALSMEKYRPNPKYVQTPRVLNSIREPVVLKYASAPTSPQGEPKSIALHGAGETLSAAQLSARAGEYSKSHPGIQVDHRGAAQAGIAALKARAAHFAASDVPLTNIERFQGPALLEIPTASAPMIPIYNLSGIKNLALDEHVLAEIYLGRVTNWNDPQIVALNPNTILPEKHIVVVHRSDATATTQLLSTYFSNVSNVWQKSIGTGMLIKWPVGATAASQDELQRIFNGVEGAFSCVEWNFAESKKLPTASMPKLIQGTTNLVVYQDLTYLHNRQTAIELVNYLTWYTAGDPSAHALINTIVFEGQPLTK